MTLTELSARLASPDVSPVEVTRPPLEGSERLAEVCDEVDLILCPSLFSPSLRCGFSYEGLPLGLQLVTRHLEKSLLCRSGHTFERATDWHTRHPALEASA